jgi:hypothetical protein
MNAPPFRLIPATVDRDGVADRFEAIATNIQHRDRCDRVVALQRSVDEHPEAYAEYCRAMR